ncbi:hypothetical protein Bca101_101363 [Brassica carinata]
MSSARSTAEASLGSKRRGCYPASDSRNDEAFGYLKRVIVTPAVYPRLVEFLHFDIQSTGQKSHCVSIRKDHRNAFRIPLSAFSSELAVRRRESSRRAAPSPPPPTRGGPLATLALKQPANSRRVRTGTPSPALVSQSFSGYGSILPTSLPTLFHRPEAVHLGDLMRYEYDRRERTRSSGFSRAGMHRHHATRRCSSSRWTLPPLSRFQGGQAVKQKR